MGTRNVSLVVLVLVLMGCATAPSNVSSTPVSQINIDESLALHIDLDDAWNVYLESSPQSQFTPQFQKFRDLGLIPYFIALSKDGMFGARGVSQTSLLSFDDYIPLLRESVVGQGAIPRNEKSFLFKNLNAESWDYDVGDFTFHDLILKNTNKFYRFSIWTTKQNFEKYRDQIEALLGSVEFVRR